MAWGWLRGKRRFFCLTFRRKRGKLIDHTQGTKREAGYLSPTQQKKEKTVVPAGEGKKNKKV